jgi:hypothetical protein
MICGLRNQVPLQARYDWFVSLQALLQIEQKWIKTLRYHPEKGFFHARDADETRYLLLDHPQRLYYLEIALNFHFSSLEVKNLYFSFIRK